MSYYFPTGELHLLCIPSAEGWTVHARPGSLPDYLEPFFLDGEALVGTDFDLNDLVRFMSQHSASYQCKLSRLGSLQMSASGDATAHLSRWIAGALESGIR